MVVFLFFIVVILKPLFVLDGQPFLLCSGLFCVFFPLGFKFEDGHLGQFEADDKPLTP